MVSSVAQIFLTDSDSCELPPPLEQNVEIARRAFPKCRHTVYGNASLRAFIADHYPTDVVETYDALRPYAYKADLGRLCLLNITGGWYVDLGVTMQVGIDLGTNFDMLLFRDGPKYFPTCWACHNALFFSNPNNRVLQTAIELIVRNRREGYYGISPLCPTGPHLFGKALAIHGGNNRHLYGDYVALTPNHRHKNMAFLLPDGTIFAWAKRAAPGDLSALGFRGGNNYVQLWNSRQVYWQAS